MHNQLKKDAYMRLNVTMDGCVYLIDVIER